MFINYCFPQLKKIFYESHSFPAETVEENSKYFITSWASKMDIYFHYPQSHPSVCSLCRKELRQILYKLSQLYPKNVLMGECWQIRAQPTQLQSWGHKPSLFGLLTAILERHGVYIKEICWASAGSWLSWLILQLQVFRIIHLELSISPLDLVIQIRHANKVTLKSATQILRKTILNPNIFQILMLLKCTNFQLHLGKRFVVLHWP